VNFSFTFLLAASMLASLRFTNRVCITSHSPKEITNEMVEYQALSSSSTMSSVDMEGCTNAEVPSDIFVPIFLLTRDRLSHLQSTVDSYSQAISSPNEIIIIDHNSTYSPMLDYLKMLQVERNISVHHLSGDISWQKALSVCADIVEDYLQHHPKVKYFIVSDPDIALLRTKPDILLFYAGILESCPNLTTVGPHLQISDLPADYKSSSKLSVASRQHHFWKKVPHMATWNGIGYHVAENDIDTTFSMRRRGTRFQRQQRPSVRTYAPYSAVHLDWYLNSSNLPDDKIWYLNRAQKGVNHW